VCESRQAEMVIPIGPPGAAGRARGTRMARAVLFDRRCRRPCAPTTNRLVLGRPRDAATSDFHAALGGEDDIHQFDVVEFCEHAARFVAESGRMHHLRERLR
jgi:hypothetical protein